MSKGIPHLIPIFVLALSLAGVKLSYACAVCFGDPVSSIMQGIKFGIISLLLILIGVLSLFAHFFIEFQKRAKKMSGL